MKLTKLTDIRYAARRILCGVLMFSSMAVFAVPPPATPTSLTVVMDDNYPPYIMCEADGTLDGYLVDAWQLWEKKTGVPVKIVAQDWATAQQTIAAGKADVIDTIFRTQERERILDFSAPYASLPVAIYTHEDVTGVTDINALKGFVVGVKAGDACIEKLKAGGASNLQTYVSYAALLKASLANQLHVFCMDEAPANYLILRAAAEHKFLKAFNIDTGEFHRAVRRGDADTLALVERGFSAFSEAEQQALHDKWMGQVVKTPQYQKLVSGLMIAVSIIVALLLMVLLLRSMVKRRTAELSRSEQQLRFITDHAPVMIANCDEVKRYKFVNQSYAELFGLQPHQLVGKYAKVILGEVEYAHSSPHMDDALAGMASEFDRELLLPAASGRVVSVRYSPERDESGRVIGFIAAILDITARKQAEEAVRASEQKLLTILDNVDASVYLKDAGGRYLFANRAIRELWQVEMEDIVGYGDEKFFDAATTANLRSIDRRVLDYGETVKSESNNTVTATGKTATYQFTKLPLYREDGSIYALCGVSTDITERKRTEMALQESEDRYSKAFHNSPDSININRLSDGLFVDINHGFERITGFKREEVIGKTSTALNIWRNPEDRQRLVDALERDGLCDNLEADFVKKNGSILRGLMSAVIVQFKDEVCILSITRDITERKHLETQFHKLSLAVEQTPNSICITDLAANIEYANATFTTVTGYSQDEVLGKNPRMLQSGNTPRETYVDMWAHLTRGESWRGELINKRKDGSLYTELAQISPVKDINGVVTNYLSIKADITEYKEAEARIEQLAHYDLLTGLPNRIMLAERFKLVLSQAQRNNEQMALMFLDLDRFKNINDTLGHALGDQLLKEVTRRLTHALREEDTVSRLGGDEFVVILPDCDAEGAASVVSKLIEVISQPCLLDHHELIITPSIGIAIYPHDGEDFDTLSKMADTAMYRVKQAGRNGFRFFAAEMQVHSVRTLQLTVALRHALARNELSLHYQPQVSMQDGRVIGAEALLRWTHPELGMVSPAEFIPIAEDCGVILAIGEWVLRTAALQLKCWMDDGYAPMVMAVNLSAVQFRYANLPDRVTQILDEVGLAHELLELELTEAAAMDDPQAAIAMMNQLHERGIRMSIDDFGTGYSSLSYLKRFKAYKLKIDQSFVRDLTVDPDDKAIVTAIINMASSLGMQTIAEGVETGSQLAFLRLQGCDEAQGYFFSKPLTAEQFEAFVKKA